MISLPIRIALLIFLCVFGLVTGFFLTFVTFFTIFEIPRGGIF
jgi:hypothetical protein